ncbi:RagB/SusD family nutrient uptake outer membrane protein [Polaribacter sp. L3A8]|uniref:RagB/SusD family nutrient uptake outer membrane protein n=1 Tax=Polaribacter sp. L3A8 TaxID=2686361 RepID=UPI00131A9A75|nr:RagB/SusD family nutrient uptake outer membrane protein [Polaribacter sp. L3A8]
MKKILYSLLTFLCIVSFQSCEKYLDVEPKYDYTYDAAVTNYTNAQAIVSGIYKTMQHRWVASELYPSLTSNGGFHQYYAANAAGTFDPDGYSQKNIWINLYKVLNSTNIAIFALNQLEDEKYPSIEAKNALIAEARLLRAWMHTQIFWSYNRYWDDDDSIYGLLYKGEVSSIDNEQQARLTVGESYAKLFEDIDFAIEHLPAFTDQFHMSQILAKSLKAKLFLYRGRDGDYQSALTLVDDVLLNLPANVHMETSAGVFPEVLESSTGDTYNITSFEDNKSLMGALYENSWDSSENIFVSYLEDDGKRYSPVSGFTYYLLGDGTRYTSTTLTGGLKTLALNMMDEDFNKYRKEVFMGWSDYGTRGAYWCVEKLCRKDRYEFPNQKWATYYLRVPELYLMQSELRMRLNPADVVNSMAPLNLMRQNRGTIMVDGVETRFLPDVDTNGLTSQQAMDILFKEYFLELGFENGSEYFATLRFQMEDGRDWIEELNPNISEFMRCWPIPEVEITANLECKQNFGWE